RTTSDLFLNMLEGLVADEGLEHPRHRLPEVPASYKEPALTERSGDVEASFQRPSESCGVNYGSLDSTVRKVETSFLILGELLPHTSLRGHRLSKEFDFTSGRDIPELD